jgi:hypothetical protein
MMFAEDRRALVGPQYYAFAARSATSADLVPLALLASKDSAEVCQNYLEMSSRLGVVALNQGAPLPN